MDYEIKESKYADSEREVIGIGTKPERFSLKSLDSQVFETPAVCH